MMDESMNICSHSCQEHSFTSETNVHAARFMLHRMKRRVSDVFVKNLIKLMTYTEDNAPAIAKKTGLTTKAIHNYLNQDRCPSIVTVEKIANAYGFTAVHLLMNDFEPSILMGGKFDNFYHAYINADDDGRRVMDTTAEYVTHRKEEPANDQKPTPRQRQSGS